MTKCWQSMQSRDTKNMNLEEDLEDIHSAARRVGGNEEENPRRLWAQDEVDEQEASQPQILTQDGTHNAHSIRMDFPRQDERVTKCLHACVPKAREKEYEEPLTYQDDQVW